MSYETGILRIEGETPKKGVIWSDFEDNAPMVEGIFRVRVSESGVRVLKDADEEEMVTGADTIDESVAAFIIAAPKEEGEAGRRRDKIALNPRALKIGSELLSEMDSLADNLKGREGAHKRDQWRRR